MYRFYLSLFMLLLTNQLTLMNGVPCNKRFQTVQTIIPQELPLVPTKPFSLQRLQQSPVMLLGVSGHYDSQKLPMGIWYKKPLTFPCTTHHYHENCGPHTEPSGKCGSHRSEPVTPLYLATHYALNHRDKTCGLAQPQRPS